MFPDVVNSQPASYELGRVEFNKLRRLVMANTGIALAESKLELVKRRFTPRLRALGMASFRAYIRHLETHYQEENTFFCNAITTNLTSFFREQHHFELLRVAIIPELLERARSSQRIRLWSAGCSTGQEAYSLAITLLQAIPDADKRDIRILATDVDENCLQTAAAGIYQASELSGINPTALKHYFSPAQQQLKHGSRAVYAASDQLKAMITFNKLNLMQPWPMKGTFEVIFCRNVFIYFNRETQIKLLKGFAGLQRTGGYLCLGHSETISNPLETGYQPAGKTAWRRCPVPLAQEAGIYRGSVT